MSTSMSERRVRVEDLVEGDLIDLEEFEHLLDELDASFARSEYALVEGTMIVAGESVVVYNNIVNIALPYGTRVIIGSYED